MLDGNAGIGDCYGLKEIWNVRFVRRWVKKTDVGKSPELIIRPAGGRISEIPVNLMSLNSKDELCETVVADQALAAARITPSLNPNCTGTRYNRNIFVKSLARKQICITVIRTPFVGYAIHSLSAVVPN